MRKRCGVNRGLTWVSREEGAKEVPVELILLAQQGDQKAIDEIVKISEPIRKAWVRTWFGEFPNNQDDAMSETAYAVLIAIRRYDPAKCQRFMAYAALWMAHYGMSLMRQIHGPVRLPKNVWCARAKLRKSNDGEMSNESARAWLQDRGVSKKAADLALGGGSVSFDEIVNDELPKDSRSHYKNHDLYRLNSQIWAGMESNTPSESMEQAEIHQNIRKAMKLVWPKLCEPVRELLSSEYGFTEKTMTLREIAQKHAVKPKSLARKRVVALDLLRNELQIIGL